jgi:hypothetical protein
MLDRTILNATLKEILAVVILFIVPSVYFICAGITTREYRQLCGGLALFTIGLGLLYAFIYRGKEWLMEKLDPYF